MNTNSKEQQIKDQYTTNYPEIERLLLKHRNRKDYTQKEAHTLASTVQNYIDAIDSLHNAVRNGKGKIKTLQEETRQEILKVLSSIMVAVIGNIPELEQDQ